MKYYSTRNLKSGYSLREALRAGLAPDGGLFVPEQLPRLSASFIADLSRLDFHTIAYEVTYPFLSADLSKADVASLVEHVLSFPVPVVEVTSHLRVVELFHGPTLAFKDFGARFLAYALSRHAAAYSRTQTVLVATSGDTGSAVAHSFFRQEGIRVVVLFPAGKISGRQQRQMTTLGENVKAVAVNGTFDDCQRLVKQAFADDTWRERHALTSANSINIGRLLPQMWYYFFAAAHQPAEPLVFSVPSGNFGNLTAGFMAQQMGLPIKRLLAATNVNDTVPRYLATGDYVPRPSTATISNAMDVGAPSNFERLRFWLPTLAQQRKIMTGYVCDDAATQQTMERVFRTTGYVLDPHGAVGWQAAEGYQRELGQIPVTVLETAHPAKFAEVVELAIGRAVEVPERLRALEERSESFETMAPDLRALMQALES